ncbi:MAG: hypothetical protein CM15mV17_1470 [Caudoviricetes sp.]|nr:MAG: hypothetical protein CM15mV17_1470 [Caudoviricetes sp.]
MDPNNFIKVYDNALPKEVCTNAIRLFEEEELDVWDRDGRPTFAQFNITECIEKLRTKTGILSSLNSSSLHTITSKNIWMTVTAGNTFHKGHHLSSLESRDINQIQMINSNGTLMWVTTSLLRECSYCSGI